MSPHPILIGIMGKKRSGKDTFAQALVDHHNFQRLAFADQLKEMALDLDPIVGPATLVNIHPTERYHRLSRVIDLLGWEAAKDLVPGVRSIALQGLGSAVRKQDPFFWVRTTMAAADAAITFEKRSVVISDVRMPNEATEILDRGGYLVRITRDGVVDYDSHESETALDDFGADFEIPNVGTRWDLYTHADSVVRSICTRQTMTSMTSRSTLI